MTYRGRICGNTVILDSAPALPEGAEVLVELAASQNSGSAENSFLERFKEYVGCMEGLPEDLAENHDHYIHGTPKRTP